MFLSARSTTCPSNPILNQRTKSMKVKSKVFAHLSDNRYEAGEWWQSGLPSRSSNLAAAPLRHCGTAFPKNPGTTFTAPFHFIFATLYYITMLSQFYFTFTYSTYPPSRAFCQVIKPRDSRFVPLLCLRVE